MLRPHSTHRTFAVKYIVLVCIVCVVGFMYAVSYTRDTEVYPESIDLLYQRFLHNLSQVNDTIDELKLIEGVTVTKPKPIEKPKLKYILQWNTKYSPFNVMQQGQDAFYKLNCKYKNCFVTDNRNYLGDVTKFDAIAFSGKHIPDEKKELPKRRSMKQKYIFGATESAHNYRICDPVYDNFFNWTWTYRLDSDIRWGYITIYDLDGNKLGPQTKMKWPPLKPVSDEFKKQLDSKSKMVAWFVSHCSTRSKREEYVKELSLRGVQYNWTVDIYGWCGTLKCPRGTSEVCFEILKKDYFFYLSFENSFAEDYVTEKLLTALNNDVVPVVFGAADYSRFLPPGSYLNARELSPAALAATMDAIVKNRTRYYEFFRWKNHFTYEDTFEKDVCNLCAAMNDQEALRTPKVYKEFRKWWNDKQWDGRSKC